MKSDTAMFSHFVEFNSPNNLNTIYWNLQTGKVQNDSFMKFDSYYEYIESILPNSNNISPLFFPLVSVIVEFP